MERMGGVLVVTESTEFPFVLKTSQNWHCDLSQFEEDYNSTDLYKINYTTGHQGEPGHEWTPIEYQVYQGGSSNDCDYVCVIKYKPKNPSFIRQYAENLRSDRFVTI